MSNQEPRPAVGPSMHLPACFPHARSLDLCYPVILLASSYPPPSLLCIAIIIAA